MDPEDPENIGIEVSWDSTSVSISMNGTVNGEYYWGIVELHPDCIANGFCWTGEDCFMGYSLENDGFVLSYCHPISQNGATLACGADASFIEEGTETAFPPGFDSMVTYILDDRSSASAPCWVWGTDPSYYNGYEKACIEM